MMINIKQIAHVGEDGLLKIEIPVGMTNARVEYVLVYDVKPEMTQEEWAAFVDRTYGILADDPIERPEQLPLEEREEIE